MKTFISFLSKVLFLINIAFAIALALSYLAPYTDPKNFLPIVFLGLLYPILLLMNLLFVFVWIILLDIRFLLSLIIIIIGWNNLQLFFNYNSENKNESKGISILSYNVRTFNAYPWAGWGEESRPKILKLIKDESTDIVCLQEFHSISTEIDGKNWYNNIDALTSETYPFYHYTELSSYREISHFGMATFSKFPIITKGIIRFENSNNNACIFTDVLAGSDTLRIYNVHLASIRFEKEDIGAIDSILSLNKIKNETWFSLYKRLKTAFLKRSSQAKLIRQSIDQCPYPFIVCGDFNDNPFSYSYHHISENLKDAFFNDKTGFGITYTGKLPVRIDYMLYNHSIEVQKFEVIKKEYSDHYPIKSIFVIKPQNRDNN